MQRFLAVAGLLLALTPFEANATCVGTGAFQSCTDASGNSYSVQRYGNTTTMQGYNSNTGSNWSQNSQTVGNTTYHNGQTNGNSWNMTQQNFGNVQTYNGVNAAGQPFSYTCTRPGGCQ